MKTIKEIMEEINKLYNKNPLDWHISVSKDRENFGNIAIFNPNFKSLWQIKLDSLYKPNPLSVGAKIPNINNEKIGFNSKMPSFGYRPLVDDQLELLQSNILEKKPIDNIILDILTREPVPLNNIKNKGFLEGPITFSPPGYISEKQKVLDQKLKNDLKKLKYRMGLDLQYL